MGAISEAKRIISGRKYIHQFAGEYAERHQLNSADVEKDILRAKPHNHISLMEYEWTAYHRLNEEQKKTVSTLWTRMEFRKAYTDRRYIGILMNKYIFSKVFADFYGRKCIQASDASEETLRILSEGTGRVVYKPNCKGMGKGVRVLPAGTPEEIESSLEYIRKAGKGIVEEYICQHEILQEINPNAVSIIRFYSVNSPSGAYVFAPVLTVAREKAISNGCQDAVTAMIDIRTGEVITAAVDQNETVEFEKHPLTDASFIGTKLPFWEETLEMMRRAVPLAHRISNVGWDVAITKDGPLIVEANTIPGFNTAQYSGFQWITDGYGYQPLFDEVNGRPFHDDGRFERVVQKLA